MFRKRSIVRNSETYVASVAIEIIYDVRRGGSPNWVRAAIASGWTCLKHRVINYVIRDDS